MRVRGLCNRDVEQLREIHKRFYNKEFIFDDLFNKMLSSFVVTDDNDKILAGGGVRTITEAIIVTDKDVEISERRRALLEMLRASIFASSSHEYRELHAFIQDEKWMNHLKRYGFRETVGKSLVLSLGG